MAGMRLRPEAEGAQRRATARRVERNERIEQERDVVARDIEIALVSLGHPRQRIEVLDGGAFGIVDHLAVACGSSRRAVPRAVCPWRNPRSGNRTRGAPRNRWRWLPFSVFSGSTVTGGPDEGHLQLRVRVLHHLRHLDIHVKAGSGSVEHQQFEILAPSRRSVRWRSCAAARPRPCCRAACRRDSRATRDTSRIRSRATPASANWRRHRSLQKTADSETAFSKISPVGHPRSGAVEGSNVNTKSIRIWRMGVG